MKKVHRGCIGDRLCRLLEAITAVVACPAEEFTCHCPSIRDPPPRGQNLPGVASAAAALTPTAAAAAGTDPSVVDVLFPLIDDDEWPPCPAEQIEAVLISHDLAEIRGVPWFAANISRGDIVNVRHDGIGYVGGTVLSRGGHSTVHVMAASEVELAPIVEQLVALGAKTAGGLTPPMLTVDIPESVALDPIWTCWPPPSP